MKPVVVISGGATGIGKATVKAFIEAGYSVVSFNINEKHHKDICDEFKSCDFLGLLCDATDENSVKSSFSEIYNRYGRVDALVNIVGGSLGITNSVDQLELSDWENIISLNLRSTFLCTREAVKIMKNNNYGRIVNMSSLAGRSRSVLGGVAYSTAKAGVIGFTRQCSKDLAPFGITVNAVAPGTIASGERIKNFWNNKTDKEKDFYMKSNPSGRFGTPEEVANAIVFLCSGNASFINGIVLDINGGVWVG
ncbi:MAG: SDR family oxidoreductase [Bacilli bacterium]|nr:SDR family oxidoreductase [Bacilli bacterium]